MRMVVGLFSVLLFGTVIADAQLVSSAQRPVARFTARQELTRLLSITDGDTVVVSNKFGSVQMNGRDQPQVQVKAELIAGGDNQACAESCLRTMTVVITQEGRRVTIISPMLADVRQATSYATNLVVTTLPGVVVEVENAYGDVELTGLAKVKVSNRFGNIRATQLEDIEVNSTFGEVQLNHVRSARVANRMGDVVVRDISGCLTISNESGSVRTVRVAGSLRVENRGGEVTARDCQGRSEIISQQGRVTFHQLRPGSDTVRITNQRSPILLMLPTTASARVVARAIQGRIACRAEGSPGDLPVTEESVQQFVHQFGDGLSQFDLQTFGAGITIDFAPGE